MVVILTCSFVTCYLIFWSIFLLISFFPVLQSAVNSRTLLLCSVCFSQLKIDLTKKNRLGFLHGKFWIHIYVTLFIQYSSAMPCVTVSHVWAWEMRKLMIPLKSHVFLILNSVPNLILPCSDMNRAIWMTWNEFLIK